MRSLIDVNNIISTYMNCCDPKIGTLICECDYINSIDSLVPIWDKMYETKITASYNKNEVVFIMLSELMEKCKSLLIKTRENGPSKLTYSQALAHVTCDEILAIQRWNKTWKEAR